MATLTMLLIIDISVLLGGAVIYRGLGRLDAVYYGACVLTGIGIITLLAAQFPYNAPLNERSLAIFAWTACNAAIAAALWFTRVKRSVS